MKGRAKMKRNCEKCEKESRIDRVVRDSAGELRCPDCEGAERQTLSEARKEALLHEAAPDLLEACREFIRVMDENGNLNGYGHVEDDIRSAVSKADREGAEVKMITEHELRREYEILSGAAPDFLKACHTMLECTGGSDNWKGETKKALKIIEEAIAKAEGK